MDSSGKKRIIFDVFVFLSILFLPWWFSITTMFFGLVAFKNYYEILFFGLLIDSLYGIKKDFFFNLPFVGFLLGLVSLIVVDWARERLRI